APSVNGVAERVEQQRYVVVLAGRDGEGDRHLGEEHGTAVPMRGGVLLSLGLLLLEVRLHLEAEPYMGGSLRQGRQVLAPPVRVGRGPAELLPGGPPAGAGGE